MEEFIYLALIALAAGLVKGLTGFGSSLVAIPFLMMLYGHLDFIYITTILISSNVFLNFLLMFENNAFSIHSLKKVYLITISGFIFTFVGLSLLNVLDNTVITYVAAGLIFFAVMVKLYQLVVKNPIRLQERKWLMIVCGAISGIGNGVGSVDGPPVVFYLSGIGANKKQFKNTMVTHSLVMGVMGVILLLFMSAYDVTILYRILTFSISSIIGVLGGMLISKRINEFTFQIVILVVLVLLDIKMILF